MKSRKLFPSMFLLLLGFYFLIQTSNLSWLESFDQWPVIFILVGISFLTQAYWSKDTDSIFPGVILTGFGLHTFVISQDNPLWIENPGVYVFVIGLAFILRYQKLRHGIVPGILLIFLSVFIYFNGDLSGSLSEMGWNFSVPFELWPFALIGMAIYLWFSKKNRSSSKSEA